MKAASPLPMERRGIEQSADRLINFSRPAILAETGRVIDYRGVLPLASFMIISLECSSLSTMVLNRCLEISG